MFFKDEWTQIELYKNKKILEEKGIKVVVIDTILKPLESIEIITIVIQEKLQKRDYLIIKRNFQIIYVLV
jgi:nitrogen regulatory protein PII-like uncharacterized protein